MDWLKLPPYMEAEVQRRVQRSLRISRLTSPLRHIPFIGRLLHTFWYCMLDEGPYQTLKPRWGALTFSFLNDGCGASVWHTWRQITSDDKYTGIYCPHPAPRSLAEAELAERDWEAYAAMRGRVKTRRLWMR